MLDKKKENTENRIIDLEKVRRDRKEESYKPRQKKISRSRRQRFMIFLALLGLTGIIVASAVNVVSLKMENKAAIEQLTALEKEKEILEEEFTKVDNEEYIEQQAREQLKMILPGETLYVLRENEE